MRSETEFIVSSDHVHHNHLAIVTAGCNAIIGGGDGNRVDLDKTELVTSNVR